MTVPSLNTRPFIYVFGHEPAYPQNRHIGDSLDQYPTQRDAFWNLLESYDVAAFIVGHTHYYSRYQAPGGQVWQIDLSNAGNDPGDGEGKTFLDVTVADSWARFDVWRDGGTNDFTLAQSWTVVPEPASMVLLLLGSGLLPHRRRRL